MDRSFVLSRGSFGEMSRFISPYLRYTFVLASVRHDGETEGRGWQRGITLGFVVGPERQRV